MLGKDINDNCGDSLETQTHKLRNTSLVILNIHDDITTSNIEEILIALCLNINLKSDPTPLAIRCTSLDRCSQV